MFRILIYGSVITVVVVLMRREVTGTECGSRSDCTKPNAPFCCKNYSTEYSPYICLKTCANRSCDNDNDCGGVGGECCDTVNKICTTKEKCLKKCYVETDCINRTYCCKQTGFNPSVCAKSCVGKSCNVGSDCGGPGECCTAGGECANSCKSSIPTWLIVVLAIVGFLCVLGLALVIPYFVRRSSLCGGRRSSLTQLVN